MQYNRMKDCIFCKIIVGEIPSEKIYEDELLYVFRDIAPAAPLHLLIVPKEHYDSVLDVTDSDILGKIVTLCAKLAREQGIAEQGFRIINNCGEWGGQTVKHLHFHLIGGRQLTSLC